MAVSDSSCHKNAGNLTQRLKQKHTLRSHVCRLSAGQLSVVRLSWAYLEPPVGSRSLPHDSQPPWTSGLVTYILLVAMTKHKRDICTLLA